MNEHPPGARGLDLLMEHREVSRRNAEFRPPALPARGDARLYAEHVLQARRGCDFAFLSGEESAGEAME